MRKGYWFVVVVAMAMVTGCHKDDGRSEIPGVFMIGPVNGSIVHFYPLGNDGSKGEELGKATTDKTGGYILTMIREHSGPIVAETEGGIYSDQATGAVVNLVPADKLMAVLPEGATNAAITPLTHMAAARTLALAKAGAPLRTAIESSNAGVGAQYGVADPVGTNPPAADKADSVGPSDRDQRIYGLVLAGLAQEANQLGVRAVDLAYALAQDVADGSYDGKNNGTAISVPTIAGASITLSGTAGTTDLQTAIDAFVASAKNMTGIKEVKIPLVPVPLGINTSFGGGLYSTMSVMPARLSGQAYAYTLTASGGKEPYTCSLKAGSSMPPGFSLANSCLITGEAVTVTDTSISPPFTVTMNDSSSPPNTVDLPPLYITTLRPGPAIIAATTACVVGVNCHVQVATATGGAPPYYFTTKSMDLPPLGIIINMDGTVTGTLKSKGEYKFGICAVDIGGQSACTKADLWIVKDPNGTTSSPSTCVPDNCCVGAPGIEAVSCELPTSYFNECLKGKCPAGTRLEPKYTTATKTSCMCPGF